MDLDSREFVVKSEDDAYQLLQACYENRVVVEDDFELRFEGWPILEIRVKGKKFDSTITPTLMKGFLEFQKAIYRSYTLTKYNSVNINRLTKGEREELEIRVRVTEGSSGLEVNFQDALEAFMTAAAHGLSGTQIIIVVLGVAVLYFGSSAFKAYLEHRRLTRERELRSQERKDLIGAQTFASQEETKRLEMVTSLAEDNHKLQNILTYSHDAQTEIVKSLRGADDVDLQGIELSGDVAGELVKNARRKAHEIRLDGTYRILAVDSTKEEGFAVKISNVDHKETFNAVVQDKTLDDNYKQTIQDAEWSKRPVDLTINAREVGGEVRRAVIIKAKKAPEEQ